MKNMSHFQISLLQVHCSVGTAFISLPLFLVVTQNCRKYTGLFFNCQGLRYKGWNILFPVLPFFLSRDSHELPESNDIYSFFQNLSCLGLECFLIKCYLLSQVTNLLPEITETRQPGQKLSPAVSSVTGFTTQIPDAIAYQNKSLPLHPLLLVLTLFFSPSYNAQFWNTLYP